MPSSFLRRDWLSNVRGDLLAGLVVALALIPEAIAHDVADLRLNLARWQLQAGEQAQAKGELDRLAKLGTQFKQHEEVARMKQSLEATMLRR